MLFKLPAIIATFGLLGLATASPIQDGDNGLVKRAGDSGSGGSSSDGGSHGGGAGRNSGGSSDGGSHGGGAGGNGGCSSDGGSHGGGSGRNGTSSHTGGDPGPSGQLLLPRGGDTLYTEVDWPGAGFHFVYKPVYERNPDPNCVNQRQACYAATSWLQVSLVSVDVPGTAYTLADFLHTDLDNPSANIDTWLGIPVEADCGNWRVRVIEHQRYFNRWVEFQSAAPQVSMACVRYSGPGA
ncbi:hypothetical protein P389DRAFT_13326 [Cystobasidium minutum MCA 4210]|uniref:uncharacterized protein n=1 Tax=Cystobasidium minutum MCA 4210 TaxID=1397322 RepID=UPI0034CD67C2|eukprot:jgi/Rhomi1/13326/CE13325_880